MVANNFTASVGLNVGRSTKDIQDLTSRVNDLSKALEHLDATIKSSGGNIDTIAQNVSKLDSSMQQAVDSSKNLVKQRQDESKSADDAAKSEKDLADSYTQTAKASDEAADAAKNVGKGSQEAAQGAKDFSGAQKDVGTSTREAKGSTDAYSESLASHRYLMYDVGATYRTISTLLLAIPAATSAVAVAYERDFAQVQRTTGLAGEDAAEFQRQLKNLSTEIPATFSELAEVAKIGGQMGVAQEALESFTETVTRFVATSEGVNIDKASTAFGRLENMFNRTPTGELADPAFFERIGSAISYTGDNSVATEAQIIGMLEKTTASAKNAGLSIQETIAMSSAMVSSGLQPFLSSGFIIRFFGNFQKAASQGGEAVADLARELGVTSEQFQDMVRNDPYELLHRVVTQMKDMDSVQGREFLTKLGINGVQDPKVLNALSENLHVLDQAMGDVNEAYADADYLQESSAGIFDTTAAGVQMLVNSFMNLGSTIGSSTLPVFKLLLEAGINLVSGFDDLVSRSKLVQFGLGLIMAGLAVAGSMYAFRSTLAFVNATLVMFKDAAQKGAIAGGRFGGINRQIAEAMLYSKGATEQQTAALLKGRGALNAYATAAATTRTAIRNNTIATNENTTAQTTNTAAVGRQAGAMSLARGAAGKFTGAMRGLVGAISTFVTPTTAAIAALGFVVTSSANSKREFKEATAAAGEFALAMNQVAEVEGFDQSLYSMDELINKMQEIEYGFWDKPLFSGTEDNLLAVLNALDISGDKIKQVFESSENGARQLALELLQAEGRLEDIGSVYDDLSEKEKEVFEKDFNKVSNGWAMVSDNVYMAAKSLREMGDEMETSTEAADQLAANGGDLSGVLEGIEEGGEGAASGMDSFTQALNDALDSVFGMVNAEGALTTALENMGKGLTDSLDVSGATSEGAANVENYQRVVSSALEVMQQDLAAGTYATVGEASRAYEQFFLDLEQQLTSTGVDPAQAQEMTQNALEVMQMTLNADGNALEVDLDVDPTNAYDTVNETTADIADFMNSIDFEFMLDADGQPATDTTWAVVNYIAEAMGITPAAVLDAINGNATENTDAVVNYMLSMMQQDYEAAINANPEAGYANVGNFHDYAIEVLNSVTSGIDGAFSDLNSLINASNAAGATKGLRGGWGKSTKSGGSNFGGGSIMGKMPNTSGRSSRSGGSIPGPKVSIPGKVASSPSAPSLAAPSAPNLAPFKKGYNDAAKAAKGAGGAGKKAGDKAAKGAKGAGNAAKKAGKAGETAAQRAAKAAQEWNKAYQDTQSWAGRVAEALSMAFNQKHAVQSAKDEYYSVLNGINDRLKQQKDRVRELKEETARLTAERRVELNEAQKFENMSSLAGKHGNLDRAKDYQDQAKAMRERAKEMSSSISANKAEQSTIQAGIGNLNGYSQAAIDNRNELRQLEQAANKVPEAYASIGASAATVAAQTRQWSANVKTHGKQLGYTDTQVRNNTVATANYIKELKRVPRNIPTVVSASHKGVPAVNKALNNVARGRNSSVGARTGSIAGANRSLNNVARGRSAIMNGAARTAAANNALNHAARPRTVSFTAYTRRVKPVLNSFKNRLGLAQGGQVPAFNSGGLIPGKAPKDPKEDNLLANVDNQGMIAVRSREFIQPQPAVDYYGLDFMEKIRQMKLPKFYAGGSPGGGSGSGNGISVIDLSAKSINQIAKQLSQTTVLQVSREELARANSKGQTINDQKRGLFKNG